MASARKRSLHEMDGAAAEPPKEPSMLERLRNMWQFANLCQWLLIFGGAVKADSYEIEELELECLRPYSMTLQDIGLSLLKFLSSHRGLTHELFDEYTRRQYTSKAPEKTNPFGHGEEPLKFVDFDVFKKIRVLHQMTQFIMMHPEKIRDKIAEMKDADHDQSSWRIEAFGWDRHDRTYYLLDDNRIYRMSEPPAAPAVLKKNSMKAKAAARAAARASKRRRISTALDSGAEDGGDEATETEVEPAPIEEDDGLGGMKWECITVTLADVRRFLGTLEKTRDANEKVLRDQVQEHLVPILEGQEERRKRREKDRERELLNMAKMANAKRSSRIAGKAERQKEEDMAREADHKRLIEEAVQRKEEQARRKTEKERDDRLLSREQRLRDREARRVRHAEELAQLSEDSRHFSSTSGRISERRLQLEIEKNKQALKDLDEEEDDWVFDCVCGLFGQVDDGRHSVACERCNVWQHSKCLGIAETDAERDDFHFICDSCTRRQAERDRLRSSRPVIKIKLNRPQAPPTAQPAHKRARTASRSPTKPTSSPEPQSRMVVEILAKPLTQTSPSQANGLPSHTPHTVPNGLYRPDAVLMPPSQEFSIGIPVKGQTAAVQHPAPEARRLSGSHPNGLHNSFTSPHPALSPPNLSPTKSRAYGTLYDPSSPGLPRGEDTANVVSTTRPAQGYSLKPPNRMHVGNGSPSLDRQNEQSGSTAKGPLPPPSQLPLQQPGSMATPKTGPIDGHAGHSYEPRSSVFLPARGGMSPTKHSPSLSHTPLSRGLPSSSPTPPILPPAATLSPFPREQNLSPPVKISKPAALEAPPSQSG